MIITVTRTKCDVVKKEAIKEDVICNESWNVGKNLY